jgi:hypothetical protein
VRPRQSGAANWSCRRLENLHLIRVGLLVAATAFSGFLSLICLAVAAGANTHLRWRFGILIDLIPALSLQALLTLKLSSARILSNALWLIALASSLAFYFEDKKDRFASGFRPITDPIERFGIFDNTSKVALVGNAVLVQMASVCASREARA